MNQIPFSPASFFAGGSEIFSSFLPPKVLRFYPGCPANEDLSALFAENFISFAPLSPVLPWARESLDMLKDLARFEKDKPPFYAWEVILRLFRLLLSVRKHHNPQERPARGANVEKAKIILQFIADHYDEDISLEDMAESPHLSKSGCLRAFRLAMHTTPYQYLLEYRLQQAAERLLSTDLPIGQIALDTGFRQVSLFGKYFKEKQASSRKNTGPPGPERISPAPGPRTTDHEPTILPIDKYKSFQ